MRVSLDVDCQFQIHDSHWFYRSFCCCGHASVDPGDSQKKAAPRCRPTPPGDPDLSRQGLANIEPINGECCEPSWSSGDICRAGGGRRAQSKCDSSLDGAAFARWIGLATFNFVEFLVAVVQFGRVKLSLPWYPFRGTSVLRVALAPMHLRFRSRTRAGMAV